MGVELLADAPLGLAMELFHRDRVLGCFVKLLDAPSAVIQAEEIVSGIAFPVDQRGGEDPLIFSRLALDQPQLHRVEPFPGKRGTELAQRSLLRDGPHEGVVLAAVDEAVEGGGSFLAREPKHRVQAAREHGVQKHEREVAPVDDHNIARRHGVDMGECRGPLVGIGRQGEVDRRLGVEAVQA